MEHRRAQFSEVIREAIAPFIEAESNRQSLITVTNVDMSPDFKKVIIFVTVFPEQAEQHAIDFLKRKRRDAKHYLKKNARLSRIPLIDFELDRGEKARQRFDDIIREADA